MLKKFDLWMLMGVVLPGVLFAAIYYLMYLEAMGEIASDTMAHIDFIDAFLKGEMYIPHPLWHLSVHYLSKILHLDQQAAASVVTALFVTLFAAIVYFVAKAALMEEETLEGVVYSDPVKNFPLF